MAPFFVNPFVVHFWTNSKQINFKWDVFKDKAFKGTMLPKNMALRTRVVTLGLNR